MPGRLLVDMDGKSAQLTNGVTHDAARPAAARSDSMQTSQKAGGAPLTNGVHNVALVNAANNAPTTNGVKMPEPDLGLPEELLSMIENNYWSMSTLVERITQECYNGLVDLVEKLNDPRRLLEEARNADRSNRDSDDVLLSVLKKRLILQFANDRRNQFVKLMVLMQWGKRSEEIKKLVKVSSYLRERMNDFVYAADSHGFLKLELSAFKQPNPDILTALETLTSATADWIPDLGYVLPKPLTNNEMRQTLRNMDALLSVRINLHEDLPRQLKIWDVANGRATFRIPQEFEFDVTVADEDPAAQFWFLDVRFLFNPAPELPSGAVRAALEERAHQALKSGGLHGCYDFLHDFVLTSKISALRKQAYDMSRGSWNGNIRIDNVHRSLIVQYWTGLQTKSWIEIGVGSGGQKVSWRGEPTPKLEVRWFRNGRQTPTDMATFNWTELSMETVLKQIISKHITWLLDLVEEALTTQALPEGEGLQTRKLTESAEEPADCSLAFQIPGQQSPISLGVEAINGRLLYTPPSILSKPAEDHLNSLTNPEEAGAGTLARYAARLMQEDAHAKAALCEWKLVNDLQPDSIKEVFKQSFLVLSFFKGRSWGLIPWAIAYAVNLGGGSWSVVELDGAAVGAAVVSTHPIKLDGEEARKPLSVGILRRIESRAVINLSLDLLSRQLTASQAAHSIRQENGNLDQSHIDARRVMLVQAQRLVQTPNTEPLGFIEGPLRLHVEHYHRGSGLVDYVARGMLPAATAELLATSLTSKADKDVHFSRNGPFVLKTTAPVGASAMMGLASRLLSLSHVKGALGALSRHSNIHLKSVTLTKIAFEYEVVQSKYAAQIIFPVRSGPDGPSAALALSPPTTNPHLRVRQHLVYLLNASLDRSSSGAWDMWASAFMMALPLLRALDIIEDPNKQVAPVTGLVVHARTLDWFRLEYSDKHLTLEIRLKRSRDKLYWQIEQARSPSQKKDQPPPPKPSDKLREVILQAFAQSQRGPGWRGLTSSIEASAVGIEDAVLKIDKTVRNESVPDTTQQGQQVQVEAKPAKSSARHSDVVDLT